MVRYLLRFMKSSIGGENLDETVTGHGAPKPVELMKRPILSHNERGDSVYGPFLGPALR